MGTEADELRRAARAVDAEILDVLDVLPILFFVLDADDRFQKYRGGPQKLAFPVEAFMGRRLGEVFPPALAERISAAIAHARQDGLPTAVEYDMAVAGVPGHYHADIVPLPDGRLAILVNDVTQRHQAELATQESERRFRALIDKATDILYVLDTGFVVRFWSPGAVHALGWTAEEAVGRYGPEFIHPDDAAQIAAPASDGHGEFLRTSYRVLHRDGSWRTLEASVRNLLGDPAVQGIIVNARDVTEQRRLEARSAESQKLESIGRLAGGVAHDFNNLLTVILSCAEFLEEASAAGEPAAIDDVREILGAANRARGLTQQLLAFARRQVIAPIVLDVNALVIESEKLLGRLLGEDVTLATHLDPALGHVRCDPTQIQQVVLNLAVNARDAMPRGGRLEIATANVEVSEERAALLQGVRPGPHVRLTVRDDGPGLPADVRAHLFEPFYTTKATGHGTGLGLATVYGIVSQSGGGIAVESEPGRGTTFEIYLPRTEDPLAQPHGSTVTPRAGGVETVLLVEDDPAVGAVTARILHEAGYRVLHARDGSEALTLAQAEATLHLLLTDVVMPGLDGRQVADAIAARHPETRVLFVSGYTRDAIVHHGVVDAGVQFLPKPFTPAALLARVRAVLGG